MSQQDIDEDLMPPTFNSCRSMMHRARRQGLPNIPRTCADITLSGEYEMTLNNQQFLLHQDQDIIIFGTQQNLQILAQSATIYMDGTFKSAPEMFTQLYTIHATYRDHVIPAIYTVFVPCKYIYV